MSSVNVIIWTGEQEICICSVVAALFIVYSAIWVYASDRSFLDKPSENHPIFIDFLTSKKISDRKIWSIRENAVNLRVVLRPILESRRE